MDINCANYELVRGVRMQSGPLGGRGAGRRTRCLASHADGAAPPTSPRPRSAPADQGHWLRQLWGCKAHAGQADGRVDSGEVHRTRRKGAGAAGPSRGPRPVLRAARPVGGTHVASQPPRPTALHRSTRMWSERSSTTDNCPGTQTSFASRRWGGGWGEGGGPSAEHPSG